MYELTHPQEHNCWMWSSKLSTKGDTHTHMHLGVILGIYWWESTKSTVLEQIHTGCSKSYKIHHDDSKLGKVGSECQSIASHSLTLMLIVTTMVPDGTCILVYITL